MDGASLNIKEIHAVYNPDLLSAFVNQRKIVSSRMTSDPALFANKKWQLDPEAKKREWIMGFLAQKVGQWSWNSGETVPILPAFHGTSLTNAWSIAAAGYTADSEGNTGFFGKGAYFTTSAKYAGP